MLIPEGTPYGQLKKLIGRKGKCRHIGRITRCTIRSIVIDEKGIRLVLDEYNRTVKRELAKFELEED